MAKGNLVKFTAFRSEEEAIAMLESLRWPNGAACPHCGGADPYRLTARNPTPGKRAVRPGLWKCRACRKQFTVKVGTIFESSHIPVSKWLMALHLLCASKKGMSAHQFHRMLGITVTVKASEDNSLWEQVPGVIQRLLKKQTTVLEAWPNEKIRSFKLKMTYKGQKRDVDLTKPDDIFPYEIISEQVETGNDGHPKFDSIDEVCQSVLDRVKKQMSIAQDQP